MVFRGDAQLPGLGQQLLQQFVLRHLQGHGPGLLGQAGKLLHTQVVAGLVQAQQQDALHAAGQQGL
ncbi:hypothetical protein D3C77_789110 [compost metagenome]